MISQEPAPSMIEPARTLPSMATSMSWSQVVGQAG